MACCSVLKAVALGGVLVVVLAATAVSQGIERIILQDVEVAVSADERLLLQMSDGPVYELAGLHAPMDCEGVAGMWACGEASRRLLQGAVDGEKLECVVLETGERPAVECLAQTRNLNLWMLRAAGVELLAEWRDREGFSEYRDAERSRRATRDLARSLARSDPLELRGRSAVEPPEVDAILGDVGFALGDRAERRGATAAERAIITETVDADSTRAGVWEFDGFRVIVGEDSESCLHAWCRFAVVDPDGQVVVLGTALGAPRLTYRRSLPIVQWGRRDPIMLVWEEPGGTLRSWSR